MRTGLIVLTVLAVAGSAKTQGGVGAGGGIVAAATPEAARIGARVLAEGGNAADAAVAVAFALSVTEPADSGLGGQALVIIHRPDEAPVVIHGSSRAPASIPDDVDAAMLRDHRATTVPTMVRTMATLRERFGSGRMPWRRLLAPSARLAEEGFRLGRHRRLILERAAHFLRKRPAAARVFLGDDGKLPPPDHVLKQPALARTLHRLATQGADDFYTGETARMIAADMAEHGGWITLEDLEGVRPPRLVAPIKTTYRGFDVYTLPPPCAGWVVLEALNILEEAPPASLALDHPHRPIWVAEALRAATRDRRQSPIPDPEAYEQSVRRRVSKERAKALYRKIDPPSSGETTHFSIVDASGMVVGVTQSINTLFGARILAPEVGVLYNNYMQEFTTRKKNHPFALKPGALAYSSMAATIVAREGRPVLALGSPGGGRIVSAVVQVASGWIDGGRDIRKAVAAPRLHYVARDNGLRFERYPEKTLALRLLKRKFSAWVPVTIFREGDRDAYFGGVNAVALERTGWQGASDPRRDGAAARARPVAR